MALDETFWCIYDCWAGGCWWFTWTIAKTRRDAWARLIEPSSPGGMPKEHYARLRRAEYRKGRRAVKVRLVKVR